MNSNPTGARPAQLVSPHLHYAATWFGAFLAASTPQRPLAATSNLDHGSPVSATKGERGYHLSAECGYRRHESREGNLERHAGQSCLRRRQRYPHNHQSVSLSGFLPTDCGLKCT